MLRAAGKNLAAIIHPVPLAIKSLGYSGSRSLNSLLDLVHVFESRIKDVVDIKRTLSVPEVFDGRVATDGDKPNRDD